MFGHICGKHLMKRTTAPTETQHIFSHSVSMKGQMFMLTMKPVKAIHVLWCSCFLYFFKTTMAYWICRLVIGVRSVELLQRVENSIVSQHYCSSPELYLCWFWVLFGTGSLPSGFPFQFEIFWFWTKTHI